MGLLLGSSVSCGKEAFFLLSSLITIDVFLHNVPLFLCLLTIMYLFLLRRRGKSLFADSYVQRTR